MATLTIGNKSVTVDDSFRNLSPADQQKAVDEISQSIGADAAPQQQAPQSTAVAPPDLVPGSREYADWAASQARAGMKLPAAGPQPGPVMLQDKFRGENIQQSPTEQPQLENNPFASQLPGPLGQLHNTVQAVNAGGLNSSLFNMGQEAYAGVMGVPKAIMDASQGKGFNYPRAFQDELALSEQTDAQKRALNPQAYDAGGTIGTIAMLGKAPAKGALAGALAGVTKGTIKRAALQSGAVGATIGFGQPGDIGTRVSNALEQGTTSAVLGAGAGKIATMLDGKIATPQVQDLFDQAKTHFKATDASNAVTAPKVGQQYASDLRTFLAKRGKITPSGKVATYPDIAHALNLADDYAQAPMTMAQWQTLRENVADAAGSVNKKERGLGMSMLDMLDNHVSGLPAAAFLHGNGQQAVADWTQARALWHIAEKAKSVEGLISSAQRQSNKSAAVPVEQATRNKFDSFVGKDKNLRGFSADEQAALRAVGNGTPVGNFAKGVGRLAPTTLGSLGIKAGIPMAVGTAIGGPGVGMAVGAGSVGLGYLGKIVSSLSTAQQAEFARMLVLNGGKIPTTIPSMASAPVKKALGNLMIYGASKAGGLNHSIAGAVHDWVGSFTGQQQGASG